MEFNWSEVHQKYKKQGWSNEPSLFAETAITFFPKSGKVLELGAGLGQDTRFFAEQGYRVTSTDLDITALSQLPDVLQQKVTVQKVDVRDAFPFADDSFDVVYAHLSLHYFDHQTTVQLFDEIKRVLKPAGVLAFLVNSVHDLEYNTGQKLENNYFQIESLKKRYFSVDTARAFAKGFAIQLLDDQGETYKDRAIGVHNLVRFVGVKTS